MLNCSVFRILLDRLLKLFLDLRVAKKMNKVRISQIAMVYAGRT